MYLYDLVIYNGVTLFHYSPSDPSPLVNLKTSNIDTNDPGVIYIGRPSKWGNPYQLSKYDRETAVKLYEDYLMKSPNLIDDLNELRGMKLACFCFPEKCHGEILLKYINAV